jgi:hypothetical protein
LVTWDRTGCHQLNGVLVKSGIYTRNGYAWNGYTWNGYTRNGYTRNGYRTEPCQRRRACSLTRISSELSVGSLLSGDAGPRRSRSTGMAYGSSSSTASVRSAA